MDLKEKILVALGLNEETKLGFQAKSDDGTIFVSTAEELENGVDISVLTEDGTTIPVPAGTYKLDTGVSFRVEDEGIVAEVLQSETEEEETEEVEAAKEVEAADEGNYVTIEDWRAMEERIKNLEDGIADLKESKEGGDDETDEEEMSAEPTTNPKSIKTTEVKEFSVEEELENLKVENEKLKTELAEQPAEAPINTNKFSSERAAPTKQELQRMTKQEKYLYNLYK
tara:strand:+ start:2404 stop:3084 length:681 start_codon:yes stop_codon:yes gene_type:complete